MLLVNPVTFNTKITSCCWWQVSANCVDQTQERHRVYSYIYAQSRQNLFFKRQVYIKVS